VVIDRIFGELGKTRRERTQWEGDIHKFIYFSTQDLKEVIALISDIQQQGRHPDD